MSILRRAAQRIRHLPGLERAEPLWRMLRKPYHRVLSIGGHGVKVIVGGAAAVRIPAEFAGGSWEQHEPETVAAFAQWVGRHPGTLVLDVGSSIGIFSVEGAELLVLRGAETFLRRVSPVLSLSVHPPALPGYGHSKADVEAFLKRLCYEVRVLAVDHEEHWWCERRA